MRIIGGKHKGTKLYTLEGLATRPTLDRVKESLFSIIQFEIPQATVLDLFSGSGALGLEAISRGANKAVLCDVSKKAIGIIEKNVEKMKEKQVVEIINKDYKQALLDLKHENHKFDLIFLDPPYQTDFLEKSIQMIAQYDLLNKNGIIVLETEKKELKEKINEFNLFDVYNEKKYGRVILIFLKSK